MHNLTVARVRARWTAALMLAIPFQPGFTLAAPGPPEGKIAFVRDGVAVLAPASGGSALTLPQSAGAATVAVSPTDGAAIFFAEQTRHGSNGQPGKAAWRGYISRPPYRTSWPLPNPLADAKVFDVSWSLDGSRAWVYGEGFSGAYDPSAKSFGPLPAMPESASQDGSRIVYTTDKEVRVRWTATSVEKTLFGIGKPESLFAAVRKAGKNLKPLSEGISRDLWSRSTSWVFGSPAMTPDGRTVYFVANAGTGQGASGNTTFTWFAADVASGQVKALGELGTFFGRLPEVHDVSPDGKRLLFASSSHSSAVENPYEVWIVDLPTRRKTRLIAHETGGKVNLVGGACWSPDSRYVAVSVLFYRSADVLRQPDWQPREQDYTLILYDASTGKRLRALPGGGPPTWTRR